MIKNKLYIKMGGTSVGIDKIKPIHAYIKYIMELFYEIIRITPDDEHKSNANKRLIPIPFTVYEAIKRNIEQHVHIDPKKGSVNAMGLYHSQVTVPMAYLTQSDKLWTHVHKFFYGVATHKTMKSEIGNGALFLTKNGMLRPMSEFNSDFV
jgi:hypothetical protein